MRKIINSEIAGNFLLAMLVILAAFHVLVLTIIVPSNFIWGGQIDDTKGNFFALEIISLVSTLIFYHHCLFKDESFKIRKV